MVIIKDILYLSYKDLSEYGFNLDNLDMSCYRYRKGLLSTYANIPDPEDKRSNLIQYNSIPEEKRIEQKLPTEQQLIAHLTNQNLTQAVQLHAGLRLDQATNFFKANPHTYPYAQELALQSTWLLFLASVKPSQARNLSYGSVEELYLDAIEKMNGMQWKRWKCNSLQVMRRKLKPFITLFKKPLNGVFTTEQFEQALDSLVHKGIGNSNREKLGEEQEACIFTLYANGEAKLTETQVHAFYLNMCSKKIATGEWNENSIVSLSTIKNFLYRPEIKQAYWAQRYGRKEYRERFEVITRRRTASIANGMWVIDGTDWHRYYQEGNNAYARLNVFVVLDAHSWCVVGFYVSESENSQQVIGALRAAAQLSRHIPHQIQSDNGSAIGGYFGQHCINTIAKHYTPAAVGNARSKVIEPFFKQFNSRVQRFFPGFTHSPVMANTLNGKPNREALSQALKDGKFVNKETAIRELHEGFAIWNRLPFKNGKSPLERYQESLEGTMDMQRPLTEQILVDAFFTMPGDLKKVTGVNEHGEKQVVRKFIPQPYTYSNGGIEIKIDNDRKFFLIDNPDVNKWLMTRKVFVKYDPIEPTRLYLYEPLSDSDYRPLTFNNKHLYASTSNQFAQALMDFKPGEHKELHEHLDRKKLQEEKALQIATTYTQLAKRTGSFMEVNKHNAFPKEVLSAAKHDLEEKILNGSPSILEDTTPSSQPALVESTSHSGSLSRWDME